MILDEVLVPPDGSALADLATAVLDGVLRRLHMRKEVPRQHEGTARREVLVPIRQTKRAEGREANMGVTRSPEGSKRP